MAAARSSSSRSTPQVTNTCAERIATPRNDYQATLEAIRGLVAHCERELGASGSVGIGTPGSLSRATGRLRNSNSVCLNGQMIVQDLEAMLGRPVRIANDANCFALSEATDGAAAGAEVVFGVILGTGVGAGIVVRGHALDGPNGIAGEWGHNPPALATARRIARAAVLLRQGRMYRDFRLRTWACQ